MKKYFYIISFIIIALTAYYLINKQKKVAIPGLLERTGTIAAGTEWLNTKEAIQGYLKILRSDPKNIKTKLALAQAYLQEARVTANYAYYMPAAAILMDDVLKAEPENYEALCVKAAIELNQHHFSEGKNTALKAQKVNPSSAFVYGLLCDAYVELGNYDSAVVMADKMVSIRPDLKSYSRVSYLREIFGDYPGAIDAMNLAVKAGYPGLEQTCWAINQLGLLYEHTGDLAKAEYQYKTAINQRADYAYSVAGLGRIEAAKKNYPKAIKYLESAAEFIPEYSFRDELTDIYILNNEKDKAKTNATAVVAMLQNTSDEIPKEGETGHGHFADRELAYAYLKTGQIDKAVFHAKVEYERRPNNIDVNETMAWVLYKQNKYSEALPFIEKALKTSSKNPVLNCRAGLIFAKVGQKQKAQQFIKNGMNTNPFLPALLMAEVKGVVNTNGYAQK